MQIQPSTETPNKTITQINFNVGKIQHKLIISPMSRTESRVSKQVTIICLVLLVRLRPI